MTDQKNNGKDETETVDAASLGKAGDPVSKGTLIMIAGTIVLVVVAAIFISRFFSAPTGITGSNSNGSATSNSR